MATTHGIIFDYGDVLDYPEDQAAWLAQREALAAQFNMSGDDLWNWIYNSHEWQAVKRGKISNAEFWQQRLRPLGVADSEMVNFVKQLFAARDRIHPAMRSLLYELRPLYKLAILSNTDLVEMEAWFVNHHQLPDMFDVVISSAKVGLAKPEPEIYHLTLQRIGLPADECLFIDDKPRNTEAAEALGLPSLVFVSPEQLRRDLIVRGILAAEGTTA